MLRCPCCYLAVTLSLLLFLLDYVAVMGQPPQGEGGGNNGVESCSGAPSTFFNYYNNNNRQQQQGSQQRPSTGRCMIDWNSGETKLYPNDFQNILNKVEIYECLDNQKRVIISNGIPNHQVEIFNNQGICEVNYVVELPLFPTLESSTSKTEIPILGIIAMAINGIPTYGPHESNIENAVEGTTSVPGAAFWYGHAGNAYWHFHNPHMGKEIVNSDDLLGYALDGFPIYGPIDNTDELDECNGMFDSAGNYKYHVRTIEQVDANVEYCNGNNSPITNWKYILGCYSGSVDQTQILDSTTYTLPNDCIRIDEDSDGGDSDTTTDGDNQQQQPPNAETGRRPNIIIIQPDDLQYFDEWGPPPNNPTEPDRTIAFPLLYSLPNIERLRTEGMQMTQAYTSSPVCGTSRFSTITGKYPSRAISSRNRNADIADVGEPASVTIPTTKLQDIDCSQENIAVAFRNIGYRTGMVGKWHLSRIQRNQYTYEGAVDIVKSCGFDFVDGLYVENLFEEDTADNDGGGGSSVFNDGTFSHNMEWITKVAIDFITSQDDDDDDDQQPFFLYFNPTIPHGASSVRSALTDYSCRDTPSGLLESDPIIPGMTTPYGGSCRQYRQSVSDRASSDNDLGPIWLDDSIGALLQSLEDVGVLGDTLIVFQQDHGIKTKGALYENGIRIPQFIHYPNGGFPVKKFDGPVSTIDLTPTLLDFGGISNRPYPMDGLSWKNAVQSGSDEEEMNWKQNRCLFFEVDQDRAVRCGCHKLLQLYEQDRSISGTYARGNQFGYSIELQNLFDLCGGSETEYPIGPIATNHESEGLNLDSSDPTQVLYLSDAMECHLERTKVDEDPDYQRVCGSELISVLPPPAESSAPSHNISSSDETSSDAPPVLAPSLWQFLFLVSLLLLVHTLL